VCTLLHNFFGTYNGIVCAQTPPWMPIFMMLWNRLLHVALLESRNDALGFLALRDIFARRINIHRRYAKNTIKRFYVNEWCIVRVV
jgi:hypothetical protein